MNLPRFPLRINVGFLFHKPVGYSRDIHFAYSEILIKPDLTLSDFSGIARVGRTPQGILVQAEFKGETPAECARCLNIFGQPLHAAFSELYAFDQRSTTESELILPEDANIDLEPLVREYLLIELPINPVCSPDCMGLCPVCGVNLNEEPHEHLDEDAEDSRDRNYSVN